MLLIMQAEPEPAGVGLGAAGAAALLALSSLCVFSMFFKVQVARR